MQKDSFDLSYGIAHLDMNAIKNAVISSIFNEKRDIDRRLHDIENYSMKNDLLRAEFNAKYLRESARRLHNSLRCLHHLVEAGKREVIKIVRNEDKIEQFITKQSK